MKVTLTESHGRNSDGAATLEVDVTDSVGNTVKSLSIYPLYECPEDASLERDMSFAYELADMFALGYNYGKEGVEVERKNVLLPEDK